MRNEEIKAELAALRAEVVALAEAREEAAKREQSPEATAPSTSPGGGSPLESEHEGVVDQVKEFVELLEHELRDTPVVSGLTIFSLGLLVGRFLR